jgi:hypothetical protein
LGAVVVVQLPKSINYHLTPTGDHSMTQQALMAKALKLKKQIQDPNFVGDKDWIKFLFCEVVDRLEKGAK